MTLDEFGFSRAELRRLNSEVGRVYECSYVVRGHKGETLAGLPLRRAGKLLDGS
jgi:hypothetical protein